MNVQSFVVYGLVIIFFIVIAALVPFVLAQPEAQHNEPEEKSSEKASSPKTSVVAYGLTAVLFALFIGITFMMQKERGHVASV
jgi:energy-converting hydrogenase Eha subunit A